MESAFATSPGAADPFPARTHPPESKWERELSDVSFEEGDPGQGEAERLSRRGRGTWGLTQEAMEWLCQDGEHPALVEVRSRARCFRLEGGPNRAEGIESVPLENLRTLCGVLFVPPWA